MAPWSWSGTGFTFSFPLMYSSVTVSGARRASSSNSSTDMSGVSAGLGVMVSPPPLHRASVSARTSCTVMCDSFRSTGQRHGPRRRGRVPRTGTARRRGPAVRAHRGTRRSRRPAGPRHVPVRRTCRIRGPGGQEAPGAARVGASPSGASGRARRGDETGRGRPAVRARIRCASSAPRANHSSTSGGELRAFGGGERHRRRLPPESREQDHRPGTRRPPGTLLGSVATPVRRPSGVVPGRTRPPRPVIHRGLPEWAKCSRPRRR